MYRCARVVSLIAATAAWIQTTAAEDAGDNINSVRDLPPDTAEVVVDLDAVVGPIKPMNAVNDGPIRPRGDQKRSCWREFEALQVPFARTHDAASVYDYGGSHMGDVTCIFPDFSADEDDPANYDFALTDWMLGQWREAGVEPFFRLGQTIEHWPHKYGTLPPHDFAKWARVCEHIIRHYNEGWANGRRWNIRYWEIWNEPDLDTDDSANKRCWGGTKASFFEFYATAAKHLKSRFPQLRIGGPALAYREAWARDFLAFCRMHELPLDFFSWHGYNCEISRVTQRVRLFRKMLDDAGFTKTESIFNEWNYNMDWSDGFQRSTTVRRGQKGAAYVMGVMSACQDEPVDMLMYYDLRPSPTWNGVFDAVTYAPDKPYWAFYAWNRLAKAGTQVSVRLTGEVRELTAVAAKNVNGRPVIVINRYANDDNVYRHRTVRVMVRNRPFVRGIVKLVDSRFAYGETVYPVKGGAIELDLEPNAFAVMEDCW